MLSRRKNYYNIAIFTIVFFCIFIFQFNIVNAACSWSHKGYAPFQKQSCVQLGLQDGTGQCSGTQTSDYLCCCDNSASESDSNSSDTTATNNTTDFKPLIGIDDSQFKKGEITTIQSSTQTIAEYIRAIYNYAIAFVGIFAVVILMFGGITWITSGGNAERVGEAKAWIAASLTGLLLAVCSWMILKTVNPALVNFNIQKIETSELLGCCEQTKSSNTCSNSVKQSECASGYKEKASCDSEGKCKSNN